MKPPYIKRSLETVLTKAASQFPAVLVSGSRQSGKTTLLRHLFGDTHRYASLESPDVRALALEDPRGFLETYPPPVILDEAHNAPDLFFYIKERIDAYRRRNGQFLLTGSQNLALTEKVTESLAGRVAVLRLLPLSNREMLDTPEFPLPWELPEGTYDYGSGAAALGEQEDSLLSHDPRVFGGLWKQFLRGGYPELAARPEMDEFLWHGGYIQTYLERDVRSLRNIGNLALYQKFLQVLAARSGQLLNLADVSRDLDVSINTVKVWLSVLEATYQVIVLQPYFSNVGKRLVKTPKVYFTDTGTLCYLAGLRDPMHAAAGPMGGAIMETAVLSEIFKTLAHRGEVPRVFFWRTMTGNEVDFVVETEGKLVPVEVKLSATPRRSMARSITAFQKDMKDVAMPGYVVHPGDIRLPLGRDVVALPFAEL